MDRHICLIVNDLDKELYFYRDLLGCKILDNGIFDSQEMSIASGLPGSKFRVLRAILPNSGFVIQIFKCLDESYETGKLPAKKPTIGFHHIGIEVENIDEIFVLLSKAEVEIIAPPITIKQSGTRLFFAFDPDGNRIEFFQFSKDQNGRI